MKNIINTCFILFISVIISCNSENVGDNIIDNNNQVKQKYEDLKLNLLNYIQNEANSDQLEEYMKDNFNNKSCFSFKYPIKMSFRNLFIDGIEIKTINNKEELFIPIIFGDTSSLIYPVTVINKKGMEQVIKNSEEFDKYYNDCKGIENCTDCKKNCFKFFYPLRFIKDSGTVEIVNNNDDLHELVNNLNPDELFKLTYPLKVRVGKDYTEKTIDGTEELNTLFSDCAN